jgi:hypothetical protein
VAVTTPHHGLTSDHRIWTDWTSTITTQRSQTMPEIGENHEGSACHLEDDQNEKKEAAQYVFHRQIQSCLEVITRLGTAANKCPLNIKCESCQTRAAYRVRFRSFHFLDAGATTFSTKKAGEVARRCKRAHARIGRMSHHNCPQTKNRNS